MNHEASIKGFWWHPDMPQNRWFGVLENNRDAGILLTCHAETGNYSFIEQHAGATFHGRDEKGSPVTLLLTSRDGGSKSGGLETLRLRPGYVLVGAHVVDKQSIKARNLSVQIQHLYGWLGLTGFNRKIDFSASGKVNISYEQPDLKSFVIYSGEKINFGLETNYSANFMSQSISEDAVVSMGLESGFNFEEAWSFIIALRMLLHLATLKPIYAVSMSLRGLRDFGNAEVGPNDSISIWSRNFQEAKTDIPVNGLWVFRYSDVEQDFGLFFSKWLDYRTQYEEALNCYSSTVYHKLPSTLKLLCLTQALDAYHGVRFNSHSQRRFKHKVEDLCELNKDSLSGLVGDIDEFATQVKDTRDYYTHHNPKDLIARNVVRGSAELIRLNEKLAILFQSCVLRDIGIPANRLSRLRRQVAGEIVEF